jgi:hypothetical protein
VHEHKHYKDCIPKPRKIFEEDKPWFTDTCKRLCIDYKDELKAFNTNKSHENRESLSNAKAVYKRYGNKAKRKYKRHEGDM